MEHFLYVFSEHERDAMLALHYTLIKADIEQNIYVFENHEDLQFDCNQINAVPSDTLTF